MELVNAMHVFQNKKINPNLARETAENLLKMLAPFVPHIAEELWSQFFEGSVHKQKWSEFDSSAIVEDEIEIVLQINGKVRDRIKIAANLDKSEIEKAALNLPRAKELTEGKKIVKVIAVPNKLVNIVVK